MNGTERMLSRRTVLTGLGALGLASIHCGPASAAPGPVLTKPIPSTGEPLPVVGMGSWITFDVGDDTAARAQRVEVLRAFFDAGGTLIDSSPMYLTSQEVIGHCLARLPDRPGLFAATKVWTMMRALGIRQMEASQQLWGVDRFDLLQVHNLLDWETHLETLIEWKAHGRVRYIGVTTSHGRRDATLEGVMAEQPIDFVQFTYNILDREAEDRLLPLAAERGLAVIINRPFRRGALFDLVGHRPLPGWAADIGCANWAQLFLKFIVSHPAVTCAIPATSRVDHMRENMGALAGPLPDAAMRRRMVRDIEDA
jgi:diketogulonate reductase-like aldo/keto reductase